MEHPSATLTLAAAVLLAGCYSTPATEPTPPGDGSTGGGSGSTGELPDESEPADVAPEPLHRLNRLEYNNTVRDLLGVTIRPADAFPPDSASHGFDNIAEGLTLTPTQLDLYAIAARDLVDTALDIVPRYRYTVNGRAHAEATGQAGTAFDWGWSMPRGGGGALSFPITVPQDETVTIGVLAGGDAVGKPIPEMGLLLDGAQIGYWQVTSLPTAPVVYSVPVALPAGAHTVVVTFPNGQDQPAENVFNSLVVGDLSITSDALATPAGRELVYVCDPAAVADPDACYRDIVTNFARRAWRRPPTAAEADDLFALFLQLRAAEGPDIAVKLTLRALLISAKFLYRPSLSAEPGGDTPPGLAPLDDFVLASRLSYFLWSSMPDEDLLRAAGRGELRDPELLRAQVRRMLADPKAEGLRHGFASQWLATRALALHAPDPATYPKWDEPLRQAMIAEAELFFADFLSNGQPVSAMLRPDFGFLNARLADHYGLPSPGTNFRRVKLGGSQRRGIVLQGAWMTATSASNRTSPVNRGRWILENLLCLPVPPPPPDIPPLMPPAEGGTVRETLAQHRENPACSGCHNLLDPAGLGMEGFDGIGARRALENGTVIDESGGLPPDLPFVGAEELAELLADDPRFTACLTDKLFTYALGRGPVSSDRPFIEAVAEALPDEGGTLDALIELIATSPAFRMRTAGGE